MRPPDENQANPTAPHLRPNLMSSARRGGNEDSILAKLEREPPRRAGAGDGARLAWYGSAVVLAVGMTVMLAWLAAGQIEEPQPLAVAHADAAPLLLPGEGPVETAVIVDAPPVATHDMPRAPSLPPLRLLEPAGARPAHVTAAPAPVKATPPRPVSRPPTRTRAPAPRTTSRQPSRTAKATAPVRPDETRNDSDVALISAVIYHANGHAVPEPGAAADTCPDDACRPRPAR